MANTVVVGKDTAVNLDNYTWAEYRYSENGPGFEWVLWLHFAGGMPLKLVGTPARTIARVLGLVLPLEVPA